jgi:amino acid transporter, AAT family
MPADLTLNGVVDSAAPDAPRGAVATVVLGAINALAVLGISLALWFVLLDPNGVLKLYTPMYGFSLMTVLAAVVIAMAGVGERWPLHASTLPAPVRGALLTAAALALTAAVVYGFFWGFLGRFGVTYFSPRAIIAAGGVGAEMFNARENASTAIVYVSTAFIWFAVALPVALGAWPWQHDTAGVRAFSRLLLVTALATIAYAVLFHPHVTQLFYPAHGQGAPTSTWAG